MWKSSGDTCLGTNDEGLDGGMSEKLVLRKPLCVLRSQGVSCAEGSARAKAL